MLSKQEHKEKFKVNFKFTIDQWKVMTQSEIETLKRGLYAWSIKQYLLDYKVNDGRAKPLNLEFLKKYIKTKADLKAFGELLEDPDGLTFFKTCYVGTGGGLFRYLTTDGISFKGADTGLCLICSKDSIRINRYNFPDKSFGSD